MRAGAARGHVGNLHEVGFYSSDAEFRALILPFAEEGIAAREPVIIGYDERKNGLLRSWLPDPSADSPSGCEPTRSPANSAGRRGGAARSARWFTNLPDRRH